MFSWDLMVISKISDFFGIKVKGWPNEAAVGLDFRMVLETFPFIFLVCDGAFSLMG